MTCNKSQEHLAQLIFGELDEETERKVFAHLAECTDCRAAYDNMAATVTLLRDALQNEAAPVLDSRHRNALQNETGPVLDARHRKALKAKAIKNKAASLLWQRLQASSLGKQKSYTPVQILWRMAAVFIVLVSLAGLFLPSMHGVRKKAMRISAENLQRQREYEEATRKNDEFWDSGSYWVPRGSGTPIEADLGQDEAVAEEATGTFDFAATPEDDGSAFEIRRGDPETMAEAADVYDGTERDKMQREGGRDTTAAMPKDLPPASGERMLTTLPPVADGRREPEPSPKPAPPPRVVNEVEKKTLHSNSPIVFHQPDLDDVEILEEVTDTSTAHDYKATPRAADDDVGGQAGGWEYNARHGQEAAASRQVVEGLGKRESAQQKERDRKKLDVQLGDRKPLTERPAVSLRDNGVAGELGERMRRETSADERGDRVVGDTDAGSALATNGESSGAGSGWIEIDDQLALARGAKSELEAFADDPAGFDEDSSESALGGQLSADGEDKNGTKAAPPTEIPPGRGNVKLPPRSHFRNIPVNPFVKTENDHFSTFALDTDTASYTIARNYLAQNQLPPPGAIRMEEFVNAFDYDYAAPSKQAFRIYAEAAPSPFRSEKNLQVLKIGVQGRVIGRANRKVAHLVFVVDISGSMGQPDRLPLVKESLKLLVDQLNDRDRITLVTYGDATRLFLDNVPATQTAAIKARIDSLQAGGSTNLYDGVKLGYEQAGRAFRPGQINRIILCSDGAANVGPTQTDELLEQVSEYRKQGITFTSIGFGLGTYNDEILEQLANKGDGTYVFIDSLAEARRVFVERLAATLQYIAKDARIQVEFNPDRVYRYRLIGYENRDIEDEKFRDDTIDAGEVGSGQSATAIYEIELDQAAVQTSGLRSPSLGTVYVRYRDLETDRMEEISRRLGSEIIQDRTPENHPRFFLAVCAAEFAEILRQSEYVQRRNIADVEFLLAKVAAQLPLDTRIRELLQMVRQAKSLAPAR